VQAHFTLGNVAAQEGALEQAVGYFEQTMDDAVRANDTVMEALACNNAAHHHLLLGHGEKAHALAQRGLALAEGHTLYSVLVYLYGTLGDIHASEQQWDQAEAWLHKGLALAEQLNSAERHADYLAKLAEVAYGREQYPLAVAHLQAATRLADEQGARYASAQYHLRLAALLAEQGQAAEAKPHLQRGRQIAREGHYGRLLKQASKTR
jgi:tetratricopeptide (TPR) repeat protein